MVQISQYNKVLNYLETSVTNIHYLNSFTEDDSDEDVGSQYITDSNMDFPLVVQKGLEHDYSYLLNDTSDIIVNFSKIVQEVKIDRYEKLEVTIKTNKQLVIENTKLVFSRVPNCKIEYKSFEPNLRECHETKNNDGFLYILSYDFKEDDMVEFNKFMTDIMSVKIDLGVSCDVQLHNIVVRQTAYSLNIKDIDEQIVQAKLYILRRIHEDIIPDKLASCITRITVAHLWLNKWYEEGQKASTLGEFSTESYYDKLMNAVDKDIDLYNKDKGDDKDKRNLDYRLLGSI